MVNKFDKQNPVKLFKISGIDKLVVAKDEEEIKQTFPNKKPVLAGEAYLTGYALNCVQIYEASERRKAADTVDAAYARMEHFGSDS